jgi:hypothetical protein
LSLALRWCGKVPLKVTSRFHRYEWKINDENLFSAADISSVHILFGASSCRSPEARSYVGVLINSNGNMAKDFPLHTKRQQQQQQK